MNTKQLAALLSGRKYGEEITQAEAEQAKSDGLVVVYGSSDDLMEFRGAINDELGAYNGTTAFVTNAGLLQNECENENCPYCKREAEKAATITAVWCAESNEEKYSWIYRTSIPHECFQIIEDGENYCRGIVFSLVDVQE